MKFDWDFLFVAAAWFVARTETTVDDALLAVVQAAKDDPFISELLGKWFTIQATTNTTELSPDGTLRFLSDEPPAELTQALFDRGVFKGAKDAGEVGAKLKNLLPYAVELMKLVKLFTGK